MVTTTTKHASDHQVGTTWTVVSGVQPVVFVGRVNDVPMAVLELNPAAGYRLTACNGERIGEFHSADEAKVEFERWYARR